MKEHDPATEPRQNKHQKQLHTGSIPRRFGFGVLRALAGLVFWVATLLTFGLGYVALGLPVPVPSFVIAKIETGLNGTLAARHLPDGQKVRLGQARLSLGQDWSPRLVLQNLSLDDPRGAAILHLPEASVEFGLRAMLAGEVRPRFVQLTGAQIALARDADGQIALNIAGLSGAGPVATPVEIIDALDRMFSKGVFQDLDLVEIQGLGLTIADARAGQLWQLGDGRMVLDNRADALGLELSVTQLDSALGARVTLNVESRKSDSSARLDAQFSNVAARDLAAQGPIFAFFEVLDAPMSGRVSGALDAGGLTERLEARFRIGAGKIEPSALSEAEPEAAGQGQAPARPDNRAVKSGPLAFDHASMRMRYDAKQQKMFFDDIDIQSPSLRIKAASETQLSNKEGTAFLPGTRPELAQSKITISEVMVDPEGLFVEPVRFSEGSAQWRLQLDPFKVEIQELLLKEGDDDLRLFGQVESDAQGAWAGNVSVSLNRIQSDKLIRLWPLVAVPKTRKWIDANVGQGLLFNVKAAIDFAPKREPHFKLDYDFSGAEVRVIKSLPPITNGHGTAGIKDKSFFLTVNGGEITAPNVGASDARINVAGSTFEVVDITKIPAQAKVRLITDAALPATLSLLDQEPFHFISKAGRSPDLGEGHALLVANLAFPLVNKIQTKDVAYDVTGRILDFRSEALVPGRVVQADELSVRVTAEGLRIAGEGKLEDIEVLARFEQLFGPDHAGKSSLRGEAVISDAGLRSIGVNLPKGWFEGKARATAEIDLIRGAPAQLRLQSDLIGAELNVAALSWAKSAKSKGQLTLSALLSNLPEITDLTLSAAGLEARANLTTAKGGGIGEMVFSSLKVGPWLDVSAVLTGRGADKMPDIAIRGGHVDLRRLPKGGAVGGGGGMGDLNPIAAKLDKVQVTSSIALTGVDGRFSAKSGGIEGKFTASVNGKGRVGGATIAHKGGTAVRLTSENAGQIFRATGIFPYMRNGRLDMTIQPRDKAGQYSGVLKVEEFSVKNASVLASLLSAASGVGLLEQLNGNGIQFVEGDASFLILPEGVQVTQAAATGASMGISGAGFYRYDDESLDIQGTISPFYLVNGIGQILSKPGEGLFGMNYRLAGPAKSPQIRVNPLSILTPGMFRDIFRRPMPVLKGAG